MTDAAEQESETLQKQLEDSQENESVDLRPCPSIPFIDDENDVSSHPELCDIVNLVWKFIATLETVVGHSQVQLFDHRTVKLSPSLLRAFQENQQQFKLLKKLLKKKMDLKENRETACSSTQAHNSESESHLEACHRITRNIVQEMEKLRTGAMALQAVVDKKFICSSQGAMRFDSPQDLQNFCPGLGDSGQVGTFVKEELGVTFQRTPEQRRNSLELSCERRDTGADKGRSSSVSSKSTSGSLSDTFEEEPLETLGQQLLGSLRQQVLGSLGQYMTEYMHKQLRVLKQQGLEDLEQLEQRLLATMRQRLVEIIELHLLETMEQRLAAAMEKRIMVAMEQYLSAMLEHRLSRILAQLPSKLPMNLTQTNFEKWRLENLEKRLVELQERPPLSLRDPQIIKNLEQRCIEILTLKLTKLFMPQIEKLERRLKETARATRMLLKSRMSNLEGRMLPALYEKDEQVTGLQTTQESMNRMLQTLEKRTEVSVERGQLLVGRIDVLERSMVGLQLVTDVTKIDSPEISPKIPPEFFGNEDIGLGSEGSPNKRRRAGGSTTRAHRSGDSSAADNVKSTQLAIVRSDLVPGSQETRVDSHPFGMPIKQAFAYNSQPSRSLRAESKRKHESKEIDFDEVLHLPILVRNLEDFPRDSFISVFSTKLHILQAIRGAMIATLLDAYERRVIVVGKDNIGACLRSAFKPGPDWFIGQEEQAACKYCTENGYACLLLTCRCQENVLVLLPLMEELRAGWEMNQGGYWLSGGGEKIADDAVSLRRQGAGTKSV